MADLTHIEKRHLERLLQMGSGYVLNFSNNTLDAFVIDSIGKSIYDSQYDGYGSSKANRIRGFWSVEPNHTVAKLLSDLLEYYNLECAMHDSLTDVTREQLIGNCQRIIQRLLQSAPVTEIQAIVPNSVERDFAALAKSVRESIDKNEPELGLDRLHTFVVKYMRVLCEKRGIGTGKDKPLHSLAGEYVKKLKENNEIESEMTERILKSSISVLEAFNHVRNNQSFAHDNSILNYDESLLIFNHVASAIRFIQAIEQRKNKVKEPVLTNAELEDEIPF